MFLFAAGFAQTPATLRQALDAIQGKNYAKAIELLTAEIKRSPEMEEAHYYLGLALWENGSKAEAIASLKKARQYSSKNPEYIYTLGNFYIDQKSFAEAKTVFNEGLKQKNKTNFLYGLGQTYVAEDSIDKGLVFLLQAREADPNNSKVYRSIGDAYAKQKVLSLAIDNYSKAVEIEPGWLEVHFIMGKLFFKDRRVNDALAAYKKAVEIDPSNPEANFEVGNLYFLARRPAEALPYLETFSKLVPNSAKGQLILAKSQYATRKLPEAITSIERAVSLEPSTDALEWFGRIHYDNSRDSTSQKKAVEAYGKLSQTAGYEFDGDNYLRWGRALLRLQKWGEAIPKFEASLKMDSTQTDAYNELGGLYLRAKRYDEAISSFDRKISATNSANLKSKSDSTSIARVYFNKGMCYMMKEDYTSAASTLRSGLGYESTYEKALVWLAQSYSMIDSTDQSKSTYERVLAVNPSSGEANRMIGVYYLVKKNVEASIPYLEKSVKLMPDDEKAHLWLAQAYHSLAKVEEAKREYNAVLKLNAKNADAIKGIKLLEATQ
jgi:superkiller protein 3